MCVAWIRDKVERGHHSLPSPRSKRWPSLTIPHDSPTRKRPSPSSSASSTTLTRCSTLALDATNLKRLADSEVITPRPLAAVAGCGERTLVLARCREVLLAPVPRNGKVAPFLVPSADEEAQALLGASASRYSLRDGRRPRDFARRLYFAFGFASQAGFSGLGFPWRCVGKVGKLQRL